MSKEYSEKVWKYIDQTSFLSNNDQRKFILQKNNKMFLGFLPLILQSFLTKSTPFCPNNYYGVYGMSLLLLPTICVMLVFIVGLNQSYVKKYSKHYVTKNAVIKVIKEIVIFVVIGGVTTGAQFLQADYFSCFMVGPSPLSCKEFSKI
ncbi:hypothetical protein HZS_7137 [Henneguya salminicola]|nr:hypothetical protein HZS_7137 [Henneguya salminicola]